MKKPASLLSKLFLALALAAVASMNARAQETVLWRIGQPDGSDTEFALAPKDWEHYSEDGFFVVGRSDSKRDWPYVHPGPSDHWAGSQTHVFSILFAIKESTNEGSCRLVLDMADTQDKVPPRIRVVVNGESFSQFAVAGGGSESLSGRMGKAKPSKLVFEFPAALLKTGTNSVEISSIAGSWFLYDSVSLATPPGVTLAPVTDFTTIRAAAAAPALMQREGQPCQQLTASVIHMAEPVEATVRLDGTNLQRVRLETGRQAVRVLVPSVQKARSATFSLVGPKGVLAEQPVALTPGVREVIVVFKTHFDIGYTDMASNIVQRYRTTMIDKALEVADQSRNLPAEQQFAWTMAGWPLHKILQDWPGQSAERKARVEQALRERRFVVHALPFTTHTELLEAEDLVRGLGYSSQISRRLALGLPRDAKMTDVPEHTWMMATLLKQAGVDFMMIGCNGSSGPLQVPPLYWWEGPDGSRVLTMYSPSYGTTLTPFKDWPYRTWLACIHTGDNQGPPKAEDVQAIFERAARELPGVKVRIGRMSDFGDAILAEKPDLPVVRGDTPDTWIHGPMSDPAGARLARSIRPLIAATETLNTQLRAWGVNIPDAGPAVAAAYEQSLLYGEHTWGGAIGWINTVLSFGDAFKKDREQGRFQRIEGSWAEHTAYIERTCDIIAPLLEQNQQALARGVNVEGKRIVVYNPLPWKRSGMVSCDADGFAPGALKPAEGGPVIPVAARDGRLAFQVTGVPPLGYRSYIAAPGSGEAVVAERTLPGSEPATIESAYFKATIDPVRGVVTSLIDKCAHRELLDAASPVGLGQYLYERFDGNQVTQYCRAYLKPGRMNADFFKPGLPSAAEHPYEAASPRNFIIRLDETPLAVGVVLDAPATPKLPAVTMRFSLSRSQPYADLEITLHDKPLEPWPEAGWLCLPFKVNAPQFRLGRLGSIINPATDIVPGANRHLFAINTGLTITDSEGWGIGLCPIDNPLVSLDTPGCWKFSNDFVPKRPVVYLNLFNNQWNTNFRLWNQGTWTSRVRIWPVAPGEEAESALITPSLEARYPLQAAVADGAAGKLRASARGLELSRKGISVTAFGANPDGAGTVLRLWEQAGETGPVTVRLPQGILPATVQAADLRGRPVAQPIPVKDGSFEINLKAYAPASVLF